MATTMANSAFESQQREQAHTAKPGTRRPRRTRRGDRSDPTARRQQDERGIERRADGERDRRERARHAERRRDVDSRIRASSEYMTSGPMRTPPAIDQSDASGARSTSPSGERATLLLELRELTASRPTPARSHKPNPTSTTLASSGMRQPQPRTGSGGHQRRGEGDRPRPRPACRCDGPICAHEALRPRCRSAAVFHRQQHRARPLAAQRHALNEPQRHQQIGPARRPWS